MSCSNCFNECAEIVSDRCVRYTGIPIPALGINTGDTLASIDLAITTYLQSVMTGNGVIITVPSLVSCALVNGFLPGTPTVTSVQLFTALIRAACSLQTQVTAVAADIATLNADYSIGCLTGVTASSDTHLILQAVITKLCATSASLTALALDVDTNYVKIANLDNLIAAYLTSQSSSSQQYTKMVPYTVVEYYGSLVNFDATGKGLSANGWDKIYLCNGLNGTPDKRGRVGVGAIQAVPGGALSPIVSPAYPGNPNYALNSTSGTNTVTLDATQIPSHTHSATASATSVVTDPGHTHYSGQSGNTGGGGSIGISTTGYNFLTTSSITNITVATTVGVTNGNSGGGLAHLNIQPVLACYYIMYIP
jgi:microcystin-dependent protein